MDLRPSSVSCFSIPFSPMVCHGFLYLLGSRSRCPQPSPSGMRSCGYNKRVLHVHVMVGRSLL